MKNIKFSKVIPEIFLQRNDLHSDIWEQDVTFEKGGLYLLEANSGKGKSTFCSYILGYRNDYNGQVLFDGADTRSLKVADWVDIRTRHLSYLFQELLLKW